MRHCIPTFFSAESLYLVRLPLLKTFIDHAEVLFCIKSICSYNKTAKLYSFHENANRVRMHIGDWMRGVPEYTMAEEHKDNGHTRYLQPQEAQPLARRQTTPLDYIVPWVIELRIVGTAETLQVQVTEAMVIGRMDRTPHKLDIDLTPFNAMEQGVSRRHAMITATENRITIKDLGSANGTFLNSHILKPGEEYRLRHNDTISFGRLKVQVLFAVTPAAQKQGGRLLEQKPIPSVGQGQRILVVEDDTDVANVFGMILEHAGFAVTVANSVTAAMNSVTEMMPDAIILDLMLSDMSGLELARYVRERSGTKHIPVVVVSGATGGFQKNQAMQAGVDLFLGKPIGVDELLQAVESIMQKAI